MKLSILNLLPRGLPRGFLFTILGLCTLCLGTLASANSLRVGFANHTRDTFTYTIISNDAYDPSETQKGKVLPEKKEPVSINFTDNNNEDIITLQVAIKSLASKQKIYSAIFSLPPNKDSQPQLYDEHKTNKYAIHEATIRFYDKAQVGINISPKGTKERQFI